MHKGIDVRQSTMVRRLRILISLTTHTLVWHMIVSELVLSYEDTHETGVRLFYMLICSRKRHIRKIVLSIFHPPNSDAQPAWTTTSTVEKEPAVLWEVPSSKMLVSASQLSNTCDVDLRDRRIYAPSLNHKRRM